jgi:N-acetylmuramoyl-L-alanine amidase
VYRSAVSRGQDESKVVFLSIHADSLHPSVRGAMVYIPGEEYLGGSYGKAGKIYEARREYRQAPRVSFSRRERLEAEGVSRQLAEDVIASLRRESLPVHTFNPIRDSIVRRGRQWVPAVLRYNEIPARILLEVCNLNNEEDRDLMQTLTYRERVARSVIEALTSFYDGSDSKTRVKKASRRTTSSGRGHRKRN